MLFNLSPKLTKVGLKQFGSDGIHVKQHQGKHDPCRRGNSGAGRVICAVCREGWFAKDKAMRGHKWL
eukprot:3421821-Amphidinium_carterae.2